MVIFHSFLQLPEGIMNCAWNLCLNQRRSWRIDHPMRKTCWFYESKPWHPNGTLKWLVMDDYSPNMIIIGFDPSPESHIYIYIHVNTCVSRSYFVPMSIQIWGTALGFRGRPPRHGSRPNTRSYIWLCR